MELTQPAGGSIIAGRIMNEREYQRLRRKIVERYNRDLEALDRVRRISDDSDDVDDSGTGAGAGTAAVSSARIVGLLDVVRTAVWAQSGTFNLRDVIAKIEEQNPEVGDLLVGKSTSVSSALKRLQDENCIEVVQLGSGKRPSIYRLVPVAAVENQEEDDGGALPLPLDDDNDDFLPMTADDDIPF